MNLEGEAQMVFPSARLFAVGSTLNGCGSFNSDMDLCVVINENQLPPARNTRAQAVAVLNRLRRVYRKIPVIQNIDSIFQAVVPILSITFNGTYAG